MTSTDLLICPLCSDRVDRLVYRFHVESESEVIHVPQEQQRQRTLSQQLVKHDVSPFVPGKKFIKRGWSYFRSH